MLASSATFLALVALATASSHSEAPGTAALPQADISDFYFFRSYESGRESFVDFIMNVNPLQLAYAGPNYSPLSDHFAHEIYVDYNGDGVEDVTFQFLPGKQLAGDESKRRPREGRGLTVPVGGRDVPVALTAIGPISEGADGENSLNVREFYRLRVLRGQRREGDCEPIDDGPFACTDDGETRLRKPHDYAGRKTFGLNMDDEAYRKYAEQFFHDVELPGCPHKARVFVGPRRDPFGITLGKVFDLVNLDNPAASFSTPNHLERNSVTSFVLEVHEDCINGGHVDGVVGAWAASRYVEHEKKNKHVVTTQVSRLGNPLFNELFVGLGDKDLYSASRPTNDGAFRVYAEYPTLPVLINILFSAALGTKLDPEFFPRTDLRAAYLEGIAGLNKPEKRGKPWRNADSSSSSSDDDDDDDSSHDAWKWAHGIADWKGSSKDNSAWVCPSQCLEHNEGVDAQLPFPVYSSNKFSSVICAGSPLCDFTPIKGPWGGIHSNEEWRSWGHKGDDDDDDDDGAPESSAKSFRSDFDDDDDAHRYLVAPDKHSFAADIIRLNLSIPAKSRCEQDRLGVIGDDNAGFPNGRRPGDDAVDIVLQLSLGALCHKNDVDGLDVAAAVGCKAADAPVGAVNVNDGVEVSAKLLLDEFPYLLSPVPGDLDPNEGIPDSGESLSSCGD